MKIQNELILIIALTITNAFLGACTPNFSKQKLDFSLTQTSQAGTQQALTQAETKTPTKSLNALQTEAAVNATERFKITERTLATQQEQEVEATQKAQKILVAETSVEEAQQQATQESSLLTNLVWKASFEKGDLSEFRGHGDFVRQGTSGMYYFITRAYRGNYAVALSIDTTAPSDTGAQAAFLFVWDQLLLKGDYYYSAWYYIPGNIITKEWWNIWQWKSTDDGNSSHSKPIFSFDCSTATQPKQLALVFRPDLDDLSIKKFFISPKPFPTDRWVHLEAYYKRSTSNNGEVIVWQDEEEIFHVSGFPTLLADETLYWSVNHYTDNIEPNPSVIYLDDLAISRIRIGKTPLP